jgi:hypothetical protein
MLAAICIAFIIPTLMILAILKRCNFKSKGFCQVNYKTWFDKSYYYLFWNGTLRYILESYYGVTLVFLNSIFAVGLDWSKPVLVFLNVLSILALVFYSAVPMLMTIYFRWKADKFGEEKFNQRFSEVI